MFLYLFMLYSKWPIFGYFACKLSNYARDDADDNNEFENRIEYK